MFSECKGCSKCKCQRKRFKTFLKEGKDPSHPPFGTPEYFVYLSQLNDLSHIWHGLNNYRTWAQLQYDSRPGDKPEPMLYSSEAAFDIMNAIKAGTDIGRIKQALSTLPGYLSGQRSMYNKNPFTEMAGGDAIVNSCKGGPDFQVMGACSDLKKKKKKR